MEDKKELEKELRIYKDRLEEAMGAGHLAWWEMELPSGEVDFNDRKAEMLGYSPEKFEHYTDFTDLLHSDDQDRAMRAMSDHLEGKESRYEVEYRIRKENGEYKWFRDVGGITEEDEEGEYKKVTGVVIDIDNRKKAEKRENFLHSLLRHDVRNKAQVVKGYLELLEDYDLPEEAEDFVRKAKGGIGDSMDLIEKVRTLHSIEREEEVEEVNICSVIEDVITERESQAQGKGIEVEHEEFNVKVLGGALLEEVFSNLIENSIKHSGGDEIRISLEETENEWIVIVEDDGRGIPDEKREKIFKRGFKSGDTGGSGLGMYLVKQIIENYDSSIEVKDSELGGARFDIHLQKA